MYIHIETDKSVELNHSLVYPGSMGSGLITPGASPKTIYLDPEFLVAGREDDMCPALAYTNDALLSDNFGSDVAHAAREKAFEAAQSRTTALFFEKILQEVFGDKDLDLKHIMVGVTTWTGNWYHDLGYLATKKTR